jgi:hypothetical protein
LLLITIHTFNINRIVITQLSNAYSIAQNYTSNAFVPNIQVNENVMIGQNATTKHYTLTLVDFEHSNTLVGWAIVYLYRCLHTKYQS